jgi:hypothetical protein
MVALHGGGEGLSERPLKWSQRWFEDPPVGTTVNLGGGEVEVHVGGGVWQTAPASDVDDWLAG